MGPSTTADTDAESDSQEGDSGTAPTHLQQLFDGGVFENYEPTSVSPFMNMSETVSAEALLSATKKLQAVMPSKHDVHILAEYSEVWIPLYEALFPTASVYKSSREV